MRYTRLRMLVLLGALASLGAFGSRALTAQSAGLPSPSVAPGVAARPHPGKVFRDCADCPEMVAVPAGAFTMGSPPVEVGHGPEEGPQRRVRLRKFAVGKFDVTRGQWAAFVAATKHPAAQGCQWSLLPKDDQAKASWTNLGFPQDDTHPVVCVTWKDVHDYADWLSQRTGRKYRLLSEAEWEYAARAGTATAYPWGDVADHEHSNFGADGTYMGLALGRDKWAYSTSPVGSFPANAFGLFDMNGNVMQWVEDCVATSYAGLATDGSANTVDALLKATGDLSFLDGKRSCSYRVVRGGAFGDPPKMVRSAYRNMAPGPGATLEDYGSTGLGFRVATSLD